MHRLFLLLLTATALLTHARAQLADSIQLRAATLAARGETALLRPLYRAHRAELPPSTRLYCEVALARADGDRAKAISCLDTLLADHARRFDTNGRLALVELKASLLREEGRYAELKALCRKEIPRFKRKHIGDSRLSRLRNYLRKAERLSAGTPRAELLGLADRDLPFELQRPYGERAASLDPYARHYCALVLARAFRDEMQALRHSDSLLSHYIDSLDTDELTSCLRTHADLLATRGEWKRLQAFCRTYGSLPRSHGAPLRHYARMAEAWHDRPATTLTRPARDCALPLSPQWPLFVFARPNGGDAGPFLLDTGQSYTLLPEEEARRCGLQILADTLSVASPTGMLSVSPAYADSLVLGRIVYRHLVVYAVHPADYADPVYTRVIGCNELLRLPAMTFYPEKLIFPYPRTFAGSLRRNLRVSQEGTLRLRAGHEGRPRTFSLDTGSSDDVFSAAAFPPATTDTLDFRLSIGGKTYPSPCPVFTQGRAADHDGLVGVPFLRQFGAVRFDFRAMTLEPEDSGGDADPQTAPAAPSDSDPFVMERHEASFRRTADPKDGALLHLAVLSGKNRPDSVIALARKIEKEFRLSAEESDLVRRWHHLACIRTGREAEAARLLSSTTPATDAASPDHQAVRRQIERLQQAARHAPMRLHIPARPVDAAYADTTDTLPTIPARVGRKSTTLTLNPTQAETVVTERAARRLKIRTYFKDGDHAFGLIDSLRIGAFALYHVRCRIIPGKTESLQLGFEALSTLGYVEYRPTGIRLGAAPPAAQGCAFPLRFDAPQLLMQTETPTGYAVTGLTPADLHRMAARHGSLRLDLRHMRLLLPERDAETAGRQPLQEGGKSRARTGQILHGM